MGCKRHIIMHEMELQRQLESSSQSLGSRAILGSTESEALGMARCPGGLAEPRKSL